MDKLPIDKTLTKEELEKEVETLLVKLATLEESEAKRNKTQGKLLETQRKLSTLINHLPGVVFRCANDENWTMEYMSKWCHELTGYKSNEIIGNAVTSYTSLILPEDRQQVWDDVQKGLKARKPYILEYRITTKTGKIKWVWEKGSGIFAEDGNLVAIEGFIIDITEQKRLSDTLEQKKHAEQQEKEFTLLDELANSPQTDVVSKLFGFAPLSQSHPKVFSDLSVTYQNLITQSVEEYKDQADSSGGGISDELKFIGKQLGFLKALPVDVLDMHSKVLKKVTVDLSPEDAHVYREVGRKMALELMGSLASYYRNISMNMRKQAHESISSR